MPSRPIPPRDTSADLRFPVRGIDLSQGFASQPPGTTAHGVNVRAFDPLQARQRGGSRPGLARYVDAAMPGTGVIQELNSIVGTDFTAPGPPAGVIQVSSWSQGNGAAVTTQLQTAATAGNALLVLVGTGGNYPGTVATNLGGNLTRINNGAISGFSCSAWLTTGLAAGVVSVTTTPGSGENLDILVLELTGVTGNDSGVSPNGGVVSSDVGVGWAVSHAPEFVYVCVRVDVDNTVTRTAGSGYTDLINAQGRFAVCYKRQTTNATIGADLAWSFQIATYWQGLQGGIRLSA